MHSDFADDFYRGQATVKAVRRICCTCGIDKQKDAAAYTAASLFSV